MSFTQPDWRSIQELDGAALKVELFSLLQRAALEIQVGENDDPELLSTVPRLAELIATRPSLSDFSEIFGSLARSTGLWNYIDKASADARDSIVAEAATVPGLGDITLHREQQAALNTLLSGTNLILSAPTSFGKSILIDALLLSGKYERVAIVLPTIALLDEFRRRLVQRFGDKFDILMHHSETSERKRVIFLGTQERLLNRDDLKSLDLVVVDEFYKLDPNRKDERAITLNAAVYRLLRRSKQFFFLGPNIETVQFDGGSRWQFEFLRTRFSTVAVNTYDLKRIKDKVGKLKEEVFNKDNWPVLVFVSSPDRANKTAEMLAEVFSTGAGSEAFSEWIDQNYGTGWAVSTAVRAGIGVHHGRIPRALASRFVRLFNDGIIPVLLCTSTLIEGVNTAAKSIIIYDKTIARAPYDFFTFSNIKGRAGRLGQHHVGNVFLFHAPPGHEDVEVAPPLFGDLDEAPDELVVHIDEEDATQKISDRVSDLAQTLDISPSELRRLSGIGIDRLTELKHHVLASLRAAPHEVVWSGSPKYNELKRFCEIICKVRSARDFGCFSASQLTLYINKLRMSRTLREFFLWHASTSRGSSTEFDGVFKFLRACEFSLPEYASAVETFIRHAGRAPDYTAFAAQMANWFRAEALKNLEEEGVPIQISERFLRSDDTARSLGNRLRHIALSGGEDSSDLSTIERNWVLDALPR